MQNAAETVAAAWENGAIVVVDQGGQIMTRAAAFVFDIPGGWAWLEPTYLDPFGPAAPALHWRDGELEPRGLGLAWEGDRQTIEIVPFDPADEQGDPGVALLEWRANVKDFAAERADQLARVLASMA